MSQVRKLSLVPTLLLAGASHCASFFKKMFYDFIYVFLCLLMKLYQSNYISRACGLYKERDLLCGDHVYEKFDAVKGIDCP